MLLLIFHINESRYAIDIGQVEEVIPMVPLREIPSTPDYVAGLLNYRGHLVPIIDLCQLMAGHATRQRLSSRIILVDYPVGNGEYQLLGVLAEKVTSTVGGELSNFKDLSFGVGDAPYLGPTMSEGEEVIQLLDIDRLLPEFIQSIFFHKPSSEGDTVHG